MREPIVDAPRLSCSRIGKPRIEMFDDLDDLIHLQSVDLDVPLQRMYLEVEFDNEETPPGA